MLTIVIPTLNEESYIPKLLEVIFSHPRTWLEVIVVDGGSTDNTLQLVKKFEQVKLLHSERGRAQQMNAGADQAKHKHLLFLHADTSFDTQFLNEIYKQLESTKAGAFTMKFDRAGFWLKFYAWFTRLNFTFFTYGDQGLLIRKSLFDELNGFKEIPLLEDLEMIRRIKKKTKFKRLQQVVTTSSRRFEKHGPIKQQLKNIVIVTAFYIGISPYYLARFYRY